MSCLESVSVRTVNLRLQRVLQRGFRKHLIPMAYLPQAHQTAQRRDLHQDGKEKIQPVVFHLRASWAQYSFQSLQQQRSLLRYILSAKEENPYLPQRLAGRKYDHSLTEMLGNKLARHCGSYL